MYHKPHNPAPYIAAGKAAFDAHDYPTAAANYAAASELLPQQADLHLKIGECCVKLAPVEGMDRIKQGLDEFNHAAQLEPNSVEGWLGLLQLNDMYVSLLEGRARNDSERQRLSELYGAMRDAADHIEKIDPKNATAKASKAIVTLRTWMSNLALPETAETRALPIEQRKTPEVRAQEAIKTLYGLIPEHPESDKIPYWIGRAKIFQAQEIRQGVKTGDASVYFADAANVFDQSIAAKPDLIVLYLEKAEILERVSQLDGTPRHGLREAEARHLPNCPAESRSGQEP